MTVKRKSSATKQTRKDILRFAPNFTAYLLPPNVVCLYSENRKFFLHGDLYCAVASAIGKNGKTAPEIIRLLSKSFPVAEIEEAIRRLLERKSVISGASHAFAGAVNGYWASLGLPPEVAEENLRNWPVRVESIDVKGASELSAALSKLGVRIAKRSPRLIITLVNDYLERRLAELNGERVTAGTPWLLVQPSGVFPLVGPVFMPGESACWTCLHDRMIRNREIKGFLDRGVAQAVAISPLVSDTVGQTGIHFAAVEIAKAIASGFRTDLSDHIASFDLTGAAIVKHYVAKRPQCSTCGSKKLRNPRRAAVPIEIAEGRKLVMTSGGYRTVTSRATVARYRKHVSPLTGVVSRLERIEADLPMNTNFFAHHNFSAPAWNVDQLRSGLSGRQLRQGLHGRAGRGQRADGSDRALLGHFPGRRDQDKAPLCRFRSG
ncbi:bacteriocin biosynthesis cyclodehydratase domain-containing protein [Bradyrhizobium sp. LB7.2]